MGTVSHPGRGWYGVAVAVALVTVVVTGMLGVAQAYDLVNDVHGFAHFRGEQSTDFTAQQTGEYTVYHEYRTARAGDPYSGNDAPPEAFAVTVTSAEGTPLPVRRSGASAYGWGDKKSNALVSFDARASSHYIISANGAYGRLAVGPTMPGGSFYGFGSTLLACLAGALVVRSKRRKPAIPPAPRLIA